MTPLSLSMQRRVREHPAERIGPWLAGLMPHDAAVLQRWAARVGLEGAARLERRLDTHIGWDCAGAVQFCAPRRSRRCGSVPALGVPPATARSPRRCAPLLPTCPPRRDRGSSSPRLGLVYCLVDGQPKIALAADGGRWDAPGGAEPSTHILKPPPDSSVEWAA